MDLPEGQAGGPDAETYLWDQPQEGSLGTLLSLEEQVLNSTFEACDPQRTGFVAVTHVLAYLEAVTGRGPQDARLRTLARSLDPNGEGPQAAVDLDTFLAIMRDWIATCQLDGGLELEEEAAFEGALTSQQLPSGEIAIYRMKQTSTHKAPGLYFLCLTTNEHSVLDVLSRSYSRCPETEEPANLESFGGEDPRPELPAAAELLSSLEDLELSNRRLAGENAKLQRSVETAEEGAARLGEEVAALRRQLRTTQQALQFAKAVDEELEDLKTLAKSLEEQNRSLLAQARQTEKEQQHLVAEVETLQEEKAYISRASTGSHDSPQLHRSRESGCRLLQPLEEEAKSERGNGKLLAERDGVKRRSEELATEKEALKRQLCECERLICQRDAILSERTQHAESLAKTLEEYRATTQELRLEISHLEEQLSHTQEGPDELPEGAQARRAGWTPLLPPSLGVEIEAIRQKQEVAATDLSSPLCGVWPWEQVDEPQEEAEFPSEAPPGGQRDFQAAPARPWAGRLEPAVWLPGREEEEGAESPGMAECPIPLGSFHAGDAPGSPPESSPAEPQLQQALVPVLKELAPVTRHWEQLCLAPLYPQPLRVARHPWVPGPVLGLLLLLLLSVLLLGQPPPHTWPHLQLSYLQPPPV